MTILDRPGHPNNATGCLNDNVNADFDDEATAIAETMCFSTPPAIVGAVRPNNALSSFDGQVASGDWKITVSDPHALDSGTLARWCVTARH